MGYLPRRAGRPRPAGPGNSARQEAIATVNGHPRRTVRGRIAVLFAQGPPGASWLASLFGHLEAELRASGLEMVLISCPAVDKGGPLPPVAEHGQVEAAVIFGGLLDPPFARTLAPRLPVLLLGGYLPDAPVDSVWADSLQGVYLATSHLAQLGHRHVALINGPPGTHTSTEKSVGYDLACRNLGLPLSDAYRLQAANFGLEEGYRLAKQLLSLPDRPSGIVAAHSGLALGALMALKDAGLQVPADMSLVGYHDDLTLSSSVPPISAVALPEAEIARTAAELLASRLRGARQRSRRVLVSPQLMARQSSGPPGAR